MSTKFIQPLNEQSSTLEMVGGKGVSLSRMAKAGFPVPGGYHITTLAYRRFVEENSLQQRILESLEQIDISNLESLAAASQEISAMFSNAAIPADVANAVVQAYASLPGMSPAAAFPGSH